jgi:predicted ArsR family transcriptional regulator
MAICPRCSSETITTSSYYCKKHNVRYDPLKAKEAEYRCTIIPKSKCPQCSSELKMDQLQGGGQYFLKCPTCSWNSYSGSPNIHYLSKRIVYNEAISSKLAKKADRCNIRLKEKQGIEVCPQCMSQFLESGGITSFSTIKNTYNLESEDIIRIITDLKKEGKIYGQIDTKNQMFIFIPENSKEYINEQLRDVGKVNIESLSNRFKIPGENALELMYEMLKEYQIRGLFDKAKKNYYKAEFLNDWLIKTVKDRGRIRHKELGESLDISEEIVKHYIMDLLKNQDNRLEANFADMGTEIVTKDKLKSEVLAQCKNLGIFKLSDAADSLKVAVELVRKTIFALTKDGKIRGTFTQKREFITEDKLSEQIKDITKVYRTIKLRELARRLSVTENRVEEYLASLIARGAIYGYIDMTRHEFVADVRQPTTMGPITIPTETEEGNEGQIVEVVREYDFVGGQLHFKVVVRNNTDTTITDVKVLLDVPSSYRRQNDMLSVTSISPQNSRGVDFYLEPAECGISTIAGTVIYKDARAKPHTIHIRPKEVQIKCPLVVKTLDTIEDIQITIQDLPSDARAFLIADLDPQLAYRAAFRAITNFDTRNVTSLEVPESDNYQAEAWFSSEAKVTGGRIVTRISVQGENQSLEIRVWCNDPGQLTGFLAKIVEILFLEINLVRKVKADARQKTLDVMSITQNLITASDYCAVRYKGKEILLKLEDTHIRMARVLGEDDPTLAKIDYWIDKLKIFEDDSEGQISDEDAEGLMSDIEGFQNTLSRSLAPE